MQTADSSSSSLDSKKRNGNKRRCGVLSAVGKIEHEGREVFGYVRIYCKGWKCAHCGPRKAALYRARIAELAKAHGLNRFLTLTLDPKRLPGTNPAKYLRATWRKFRVYLRREFGERVSFISVVEEHKSGVPHLHVLVDRFISQKWTSEKWSRLGGGRIVFIEQVADLERIGWYLGKYLTKEMILGSGKGCRRVTTSRDIKLVEADELGNWLVLKAPLEQVHRVMAAEAAEEEFDSEGRLRFFVSEGSRWSGVDLPWKETLQ